MSNVGIGRGELPRRTTVARPHGPPQHCGSGPVWTLLYVMMAVAVRLAATRYFTGTTSSNTGSILSLDETV
jgi:tryptophan-rich sensory protein